MKFGNFYELEIPRPWEPGKEQRIFREGLAQVELADRLGFDSVWATEYHFLEEYAHSSAPEVFLAACSQRTKRIRLGQGRDAAAFGLQPSRAGGGTNRNPGPGQ